MMRARAHRVEARREVTAPACPRCPGRPLDASGQCALCRGAYLDAGQAGKFLGPKAFAALLAQEDGAARGLSCPACGAVSGWSHRKDGIDALYTYRNGKPEKTGLLRVDHQTIEELAGAPILYAKSHVYRVRFWGTGKPLGLHSVDAVNNNSWPDNSGAILVRLYGARP